MRSLSALKVHLRFLRTCLLFSRSDGNNKHKPTRLIAHIRILLLDLRLKNFSAMGATRGDLNSCWRILNFTRYSVKLEIALHGMACLEERASLERQRRLTLSRMTLRRGLLHDRCESVPIFSVGHTPARVSRYR